MLSDILSDMSDKIIKRYIVKYNLDIVVRIKKQIKNPDMLVLLDLIVKLHMK